MDLSSSTLWWRGLVVSGEPDARVTMREFDGWESLPDAGRPSTSRPLAHGQFDDDVLSDGRTVTASGQVVSAERDAILAELQDAMWLPGPGGPTEPLVVDHAGRTLEVSARLTRFSAPAVAWGSGVFRWAAQWWCPDPLRYGPEVTTSTPLPERIGGLEFPLFGAESGPATGFLEWGPRGETGRRTLTNEGTAATAPVATVTGPLPRGFSLTSVTTGEVIQWSGALAAGEFVTVDFGARRVRLGGTVDRTVLLTRRQWWSVPRRGEVVAAFTAPTYDAAASCAWSVRGAWW